MPDYPTWNDKPVNPTPSDPRDLLDRDTVLLSWQQAKDVLEAAKANEMSWRKYVVKRAFPNPDEGMNTLDLGNNYQLKASVKYNYNLDTDNKKVNAMLDKLATTGNDGSFIAERLVSWKPSFLLIEYRVIQEEAEEGNELAKQRLKIIAEALTITNGAPTLDIKENKKGSKK